MFTEIKFKKVWQAEQENADSKDTNSAPFQEELIGYNFLRNIWGTYFFDREQFSAEDKIDSINKIVGMMKAQIRLMILNEAKQNNNNFNVNQKILRQSEIDHNQQKELSQLKQKLQRSKMKEEEMYTILEKLSKHILCLQYENQSLRNQVQKLKQVKNKASQQIITLSSRCYDLQRLKTAPSLTSLDQFSAKSCEHQDNEERPKISLLGRKDSKIVQRLCEDTGSLHSQQDVIYEKQSLHELNLNFDFLKRNPMKQSLPIDYKKQVSQQSYHSFIEEMKLIKRKTEKIIGIEKQAVSQMLLYRKTLQPYTDRPVLKEIDTPIKILHDKRFKRIR